MAMMSNELSAVRRLRASGFDNPSNAAQFILIYMLCSFISSFRLAYFFSVYLFFLGIRTLFSHFHKTSD